MSARACSSGVRYPVRRAARLHAALTALAFVLSSLFGLIHEGTTTHIRCAEHGELIDGGPAVASPASPTTTAIPRATQAASRAAIGRGTTVRDLEAIALHGHEHCTLASAMRQSRVVPRPPVVVPARVAVGDLEMMFPRVAVVSPRALYRTAPKTSPPV